MSFIQSSPLLRNALALDAVACAGMGLLLATAAGPLAAPLGLPEALLRGAGLLLLPCAALLGFLASRKALPRLAVYAVIGINLGHLWDQAEMQRAWMRQIIAWYDDALFRPHIDRTFKFSEAAEAHDYIQDRKNTGKVLLAP